MYNRSGRSRSCHTVKSCDISCDGVGFPSLFLTSGWDSLSSLVDLCKDLRDKVWASQFNAFAREEALTSGSHTQHATAAPAGSIPVTNEGRRYGKLFQILASKTSGIVVAGSASAPPIIGPGISSSHTREPTQCRPDRPARCQVFQDCQRTSK